MRYRICSFLFCIVLCFSHVVLANNCLAPDTKATNVVYRETNSYQFKWSQTNTEKKEITAN